VSSPSDALDAFLANYSREAREMTLCLRELILEVFPHAVEEINLKNGSLEYGNGYTCENKIFVILVHMKYLYLLFTKGAQLNNSSGFLTGTGKQTRHIKIRSEAQTQNPAIRILLQEALRLDNC
jgi:hypothetical protein